jgi:hypothetical protein
VTSSWSASASLRPVDGRDDRHTLSATETLIGQIYLVTIVAVIVSKPAPTTM